MPAVPNRIGSTSSPRWLMKRPKVLIGEGGVVGWRWHLSRSRIVYLAGGAVVAALVAGIIFIRLSSTVARGPDMVSVPRHARSLVASQQIPDPMTQVAKDNTMLAAEPNPSKLSRAGLESEEGGVHKRVRRPRAPNRRAQNQTVADDRVPGPVKQGTPPTDRHSAAYPAVGDPLSSRYPAVR